jgi:hypothetical protein
VDMDTPQDGENVMTMTRKRPNLAEFAASADPSPDGEQPPRTAPTKPVHKSVYIPPAVLDQLDLLALQERPGPGRKKKFNTFVLEGLDLLLKKRGLPGVAELTYDL